MSYTAMLVQSGFVLGLELDGEVVLGVLLALAFFGLVWYASRPSVMKRYSSDEAPPASEETGPTPPAPVS